MASTRGRQVVVPLTNKSGGSVAAGDVVILDSANDESFTTTTTAGYTGGVGIAQDAIASNAVGRVLIGGYAALVNVAASVTRGDYGSTNSVAKQAVDSGATRAAGTFCRFLKGGTSPSAWVYPVDLGAGSGIPVDGWIAAGETWTYAAADSPSFTFTIAGDQTGKYQPGMRIKLTQTTAKYFIITAASYSAPNTTITVFGGTDYTLANAAITSPYYSPVKAPFGFPGDAVKWTHVFTDGGQAQASATVSTYYNPGSSKIDLPIGSWRVSGRWNHRMSGSTAAQGAVASGLSTANNSHSDSALTARLTGYIYTNTAEIRSAVHVRKAITVTVKTSYYIVLISNQNAGTVTIGTDDVRIEAECAYL